MLSRACSLKPPLVRSRVLPRTTLSRTISTRPGKPVPKPTSEVDPQTSPFVQENYVQSTVFTLEFFARFLRYSAIGLVAVGVTAWTAYEGTHMWVEKVELARDTDPEVHKYEWDIEAERWTGGNLGGTDRGLGVMGRHAVRSAWIAQNWGVGSTGSVIGSNAFTGRGGSGAGGLNVIESRLEYAQAFLTTAHQVALQRNSTGKLRPQTVTELLHRHANIMERMGTRDALFEARSEFERVWAALPDRGLDAARIALKLGDLNRRLGEPEEALSWWSRAMHLIRGDDRATPVEVPPSVPDTVPSSPLAQRILISTLVSLSAFYATSGQLKEAKAVEESSLNLLRSIRQPDSVESSSPPQTLHALYILHRSSLLSIHLAEVLYGLRDKSTASMEWLTRAAESSERVACVLTGLPPVHPDAPQSNIPHPPASEATLVRDYSKSLSMRAPAKSLLRDARRTAAEAWNLLGILSESTKAPGSMEKALDCYERALGWAGVSGDRAGGIGQAGDGTLESEWMVLWNNYVRARNAVRKDEAEDQKKD